MKKIINSLFILLTLALCSSCLNGGLEDLPEYSDAKILSVSRVEYRYISDEISPASGQPIVKYSTLSHSADVDYEAGTVAITVKVPDGFPQAELPNLSASSLVVSLNISTAARISPVSGSATLGVPADWSKTNTYTVVAADGSKREWNVTLTLNK